jgi:hypothetical protein
VPIDRPLALRPIGHAGVTRIAEGNGLLAMQQVVRLRDVRHVGGGADHRVNQPAFGIDTDMRLSCFTPRHSSYSVPNPITYRQQQ